MEQAIDPPAPAPNSGACQASWAAHYTLEAEWPHRAVPLATRLRQGGPDKTASCCPARAEASAS